MTCNSNSCCDTAYRNILLQHSINCPCEAVLCKVTFEFYSCLKPDMKTPVYDRCLQLPEWHSSKRSRGRIQGIKEVTPSAANEKGAIKYVREGANSPIKFGVSPKMMSEK